METNVARINGIKTHLERLSDDELENHMSYAHGRIEAAVGDLETLGIESARRFAIVENIADIATSNVVELFPGQGTLFPGPDAA